jgi:hypothetical protein
MQNKRDAVRPEPVEGPFDRRWANGIISAGICGHGSQSNMMT